MYGGASARGGDMAIELGASAPSTIRRMGPNYWRWPTTYTPAHLLLSRNFSTVLRVMCVVCTMLARNN